ncbi:MAG: TIR domain-containing protein [Alphaproteobacteria bacterium]|nr:TIR domain-containing protein [Alphaproteobacteria bacterium]
MAGEIFISYRRADQAWAKRLHELLRAEGVEAWYDAHVGAGEDWRTATARALEESKIFVLLFSQNAAQSSDIAKELAAAVLEKKLIVPIRLENIAPKGAFLYELASRNWINAYDDTDAKLSEVAKALAQLVQTGARDENLLPFDHSGGEGGRKPSRKPVFVGMAAVAFIAMAATAAWLLWPAAHWMVAGSRPFIATLALEGEPAFSPDGKMLAYVAGPNLGSGKIYVRNLAGGDAIKITNDAYNDASPSWSSDGARIAYIGLGLVEGEPCHLMIATVPAGEAREVGRCRRAAFSTVAWQPGANVLYYIDQKEGGAYGVVRLDLDSGTRSDIAAASLGSLSISPDGKFLAYSVVETQWKTHLRIRDLTRGTDKNLCDTRGTASLAWSNSFAWSADSRTLLATSSKGIGSEIIACPLDGTPPYSIYAAATGISQLSAGAGGLLAIQSHSIRKNLARASPTPIAQPDIIDAAAGVTASPTFTPDGMLAFTSDRSGSNAIWILKPGGTPTQLFDAGFAGLGRQIFSPDGSLLAVAISKPDSTTIKILTPAGASVASFDVSNLGYGLPTWTPDSKALIVWDGGTHRAVRVEIANPAHRTPAAPPDWQGVSMYRDATYAVRLDKPGIWRIDHGIRLLSAKYPVHWAPTVTFRNDEVLIPDFMAADGPRILAQPLAGGPDRVIAYAPGAEGLHYTSRIAVNLKTGEIIYVASVQSDTNIDLLTLAQH